MRRILAEMATDREKKYALQEKVDELEITLRSAERDRDRNKEAKEIQDKRGKWLQDELDTKQQELQKFRTDKGEALRELQQKADDSTEEAEKKTGQLGAVRKQAEQAEAKIEQLETQLEEKKAALTEQDQRYTVDLIERKKLETIYEEAKKEAEGRLHEMTQAQKEAQVQAQRQVRQLEQKIKDAEIGAASWQEQVKQLGAQLKTAEAARSKPAPASPAAPADAAAGQPAAAAAGSGRLSDIFRENAELREKVGALKLETKRLNNYLSSILTELEQKAPILEEQRGTYERAVRSHTRKSKKLDEVTKKLDEQKQVCQAQVGRLEGELTTLRTTNANLERDAAELGQQVQQLHTARGQPTGGDDDIPTLAAQNRKMIARLHGLGPQHPYMGSSLSESSPSTID